MSSPLTHTDLRRPFSSVLAWRKHICLLSLVCLLRYSKGATGIPPSRSQVTSSEEGPGENSKAAGRGARAHSPPGFSPPSPVRCRPDQPTHPVPCSVSPIPVLAHQRGPRKDFLPLEFLTLIIRVARTHSCVLSNPDHSSHSESLV